MWKTILFWRNNTLVNHCEAVRHVLLPLSLPLVGWCSLHPYIKGHPPTEGSNLRWEGLLYVLFVQHDVVVVVEHGLMLL